jgi:16S rRNA pseudouridine516 synthase
MVRIDGLLANLGYGSRKEVKMMIKNGWVDVKGEAIKDPSLKVEPETVMVDDEPLDPLSLVIVMNKPQGVVCSHKDSGKLIYSLLPERFGRRNPPLSTVGRLDRDTTGVIIITDDGILNHELTSPKKEVVKVYDVTLADPLKGDEGLIFASGKVMLDGDEKPCLPAKLTVIDDTHAQLELTEGRYHQVKRMFAAVGNKVVQLHRSRFGDITVDDLKEGEFKILKKGEM